MKMTTRFFLTASLVVVLAISGIAIAAEKAPAPPAIKVKPDIIITKLNIDQTLDAPTRDDVRISVTVWNTVKGTSTGPFKIKVEWTEDPTVGWTYLNEGGVANLVNDPSLAVLKTKTLYFDHVVPTGKAYKYRVTADYLDQVDEAREDNNVASAGYVSR